MDNRIKLLEEILSFRIQGVEFDNGDMYVDGHNAASDVRDEFVSVSEKLMDELAQCYNLLTQLYINKTIDLFFQAEDGMRFLTVTGVQTCALPISPVITQASPVVAQASSRARARDLLFGNSRFLGLTSE